MSPQASQLLIEQIVPRLRASIPRCVRPVGCEDAEELLQDSIAVAAHLLHRAENQQTEVPPGMIVHCTVIYMKSGWRSHTRSETDAMGSVAQLEKGRVLSFAERILDPNTEESVSLEELLGTEGCPALRARAWEQFLAAHDRE